MIRQSVQSLLSFNTKIFQNTGDSSLNLSEVKLNNYPVYFLYGDSDVQFSAYKIGQSIPINRYYTAINEALRLLIIFKPFESEIIISPSSIIQSNLTEKLFNSFACFSNEVPNHIILLRRESCWKDYFEKRMNESFILKEIPKYGTFYTKDKIEKVKEFSTTNKSFKAGFECSTKWVEETHKILKTNSGTGDVSIETLSDISKEVLGKGIFVWEAIWPSLLKLGLKDNLIDSCKIALINSYLSIYNDKALLPTGINLPWEFWPLPPKRYYANLKILYQIIKIAKIEKYIFNASPSKLLPFLIDERLINFKILLETGESNGRLLEYAIKNKKLIYRAAKKIS